MVSTPVKFVSGILLVALPLYATTTFCRPSFANAIHNHLLQEEIEAKRQHAYKSDYYEKNEQHDEMLAAYATKGKGKARDFTPATSL